MAAMRFVTPLLIALMLTLPALAADQWQAREVARINNCPPKKIEVFKATPGAMGNTIYRVDCNMPKGKGGDGKVADALLITCDETICELLKPVMPEGK